LRSPAKEAWVGADDQRVGVKLLKSCERLVDLAFIAGVDDLNLMGRSPHVTLMLLLRRDTRARLGRTGSRRQA
jgi:hypothetical protein